MLPSGFRGWGCTLDCSRAWAAPSSSPGSPAHHRGARIGRVLGIVLAIGILSAILSLGLQGVDALGDAACRHRIGRGVGDRMGNIPRVDRRQSERRPSSLHGWAFMRPAGWRRACSLLALCGVGLSLASSGHASAAAPQWLTRPAVFLHAVGVAYWIGALFPLAVIVRKAPSDALPIVRRFSCGALVAVAMLSLAGIVLAAIQVEALANLTGTDYGRILIAKTLLVMLLLALAALNRLWLTPGLATPSKASGTWLVRSVGAEIVLCVAILAAVGLWRFTPPPRALADSADAAASASVHLHTPRIMAQVTLSPGRVGNTRARIVIASGRAEPIDAKEVTLILSKPDAGIEAITRQAVRSERNAWEVDALPLCPLAGPWQAKVSILINDFEQATLEGTVTVGP